MKIFWNSLIILQYSVYPFLKKINTKKNIIGARHYSMPVVRGNKIYLIFFIPIIFVFQYSK